MRKTVPSSSHPIVVPTAVAVLNPPLAVAAPAFAAYIGLDRADAKLDVCLQVAASATAPSPPSEVRVLPNEPGALHEWVAHLRHRFEGAPVAVAFEQPAAGLLQLLMSYDFITVYALNPMTLVNYRRAFTTSRAKDDTRDAACLMELARDHRAKLTPWRPHDVTTRTVLALSEARRKTLDLRTQLSNRLRDQLKVYFPQALDLVGDDLYCALTCDFLLKWPTLQALQRARPSTILQFYRDHQSRSAERNEERLALIASTCPLSHDAALLQVGTWVTTTLATQLKALIPALTAVEAQLEALVASHPDAFIFASLPGAGPVHTARLTATFGTDRSRFASAEEVARYTGIAPVIKQSGKSRVVQRRRACSHFLHQSVLEYAHSSRLECAWANAFYEQQRARGQGHFAAIRALAYKWIRILFRCWQDRVIYDEAAYLAALQRHRSPLLTPPIKAAPAPRRSKGGKRNVTVQLQPQPRARCHSRQIPEVRHHAPAALV